jgi:putative nucleotidyltransferase with HDIG domain
MSLEKESDRKYSGFDVGFSKYLSEKSISEMVKVNSEIDKIFNRLKIPVKINMNILNNLVHHHLPHTKKIALGIANNLPKTYKRFVNRKSLMEATSLHDIAKVIIPENIINKAGALNAQELEIMQEHAELSYEMLKNTDLSTETLDLIKNHHHNSESDINLQILSMADIYSALREKRSYKSEMSRTQALEILKKETQNGKFHPYVYNALVDYAQKEEKLNHTDSKWNVFDFKFVNSLSA